MAVHRDAKVMYNPALDGAGGPCPKCTVTVEAHDEAALESGDMGVVRFRLAEPPIEALSVQIQVAGKATANDDHASVGESLRIPAVAENGELVIRRVNDHAGEGAETLVITLEDRTVEPYAMGPITQATVAIAGDGTAPPSPTFSAGSQVFMSMSEGAAPKPFEPQLCAQELAGDNLAWHIVGPPTHGQTSLPGAGNDKRRWATLPVLASNVQGARLQREPLPGSA